MSFENVMLGIAVDNVAAANNRALIKTGFRNPSLP
jgi:hypothetical protein